MHHALEIPEILDAILLFNASLKGRLYPCLLVNSWFFRCTAPILWRAVGSDSHADEPEPRAAPPLRSLLDIARRDKGRGRSYANLVKYLSLRVGGTSNGDLVDLSFEWESMEELAIIETKYAQKTSLSVERLRPFLAPGLKRLELHLLTGLEERFFSILMSECPELTSLTLIPNIDKGPTKNATEDSVPNAPEDMAVMQEVPSCEFPENEEGEGFEFSYPSETFRVDEEWWPLIQFQPHVWRRGWDENVLRAISRYSSLEHASVPELNDIWIQELIKCEQVEGTMSFPALRSLRTACSAPTVPLLQQIAPQLSRLSLDLRAAELSMASPVLLHMPRFTNMSSLDIQFPTKATLCGSDLVQLLQSSPSLSCLSIGKGQRYPNQVVGLELQDEDFENLAYSARNLKELYLLFLPPYCEPLLSTEYVKFYPKNGAIEALSRHCTRLERLWLTCDPNWYRLAKSNLPTLFPCLWDLRVQGPEMRCDLIGDRNTDKVARGFADRCPRLREMQWIEPYEEIRLDMRVVAAIEQRGRRNI